MQYADKFLLVMEQEIEGEAQPEVSDQEAFKQTLDDTVPASKLETETNPVHQYKQELLAKQEGLVGEWINKIDEFAAYLNGLDGQSIQHHLSSAECETLLTKVATTESRKISRVSQELKSIVEALKGYLMASK